MRTQSRSDGLFGALLGDGRSLLSCLGWGLVVGGGFALFQSATGDFLPHDVRYLGMTAQELCAKHHCRVVHFMFHDRVAFGGALVGIGTLYLWMTEFPLRRRESWAWWGIAVSGLAGFASFLTLLGFGYFDLWHGVATAVLLMCFVAGLWRTRTTSRARLPVRQTYRGKLALLCVGLGLVGGGLTITVVGATVVFVPQDLKFMDLSTADLRAISPRLIPLIGHDRAGFGGALLSCGLAWVYCVWNGAPTRALWQALCVTGVTGFVTAIGIHLVVGYVDFVHLGPALVGSVIFVAGMSRSFWPMCRKSQTNWAWAALRPPLKEIRL